MYNTRDYWGFGLGPLSSVLYNAKGQHFGNWKMVSQREHLQIKSYELVFMDLVCWVGLLHKIPT
jgi:hypothetical protein